MDKLNEIFDRVESFAQSPPTDRQAYIVELQNITKELQTIKPGTTAYANAQKLLISVNKRLKS